MESIASRLKIFLKHKKLGTSDFTRQLKYKSCEKIARLFRVENAKPSVDIVADIAARFSELSIRWLLTGEGTMLRHTAATRSATQPENILRAEALESLLLQSRMEEPDVTHRISIAENI
ncbi:hypothetical protein [Chitinophaga sp.]|uniref:hypothetical protein n=1 Tax=Chitinophaga sp. TaxID=1869181 RepID=UPI00261C263E|nr:hypothetical protein [uncultured Chitinophaga sp.]